MENPHGVPPTRYRKREESCYVIYCDPNYGPRLGSDIVISNNCNNHKSCWTENDGTRGYECHPKYKSSLFVNSAGTDKKNYFTVSDYEVYAH